MNQVEINVSSEGVYLTCIDAEPNSYVVIFCYDKYGSGRKIQVLSCNLNRRSGILIKKSRIQDQLLDIFGDKRELTWN